jgi:long-chain acyl-CoA synthetase
VGLLELTDAEPDAPALDDLARRRTRRELLDRAQRAVALLRAAGVGPDDHVAVLAGNRVEVIELALAALVAGAWCTPVNRHLTADEVRYVLTDSGSRVLFVDDAHEELAAVAGAGCRVVRIGPELDAELASLDPVPVDRSARPGGNMFYTSGTTGRPKGVKRARAATLGDTLAGYGRTGHALGLDGGGPHLVTGPLHHAAPLGFAVMDQHNGAEVVLLPRFEAAAVLAAIDDRGIRNTHLVPTMFVRLLALAEEERARFDGATLRTVLHGAAPIAPAVKRAMIAWWGEVLVEYWGASEGGVVTLARAREWLDRPGTVGRAVAGQRVWAADDDGVELPSGSTGLLWAHNPVADVVFTYHGDPAKTAGASAGPGTYTIGDIGWVDDDGYVFLADRAAHMIISGGVNIYPAEIEGVLVEHPAIADVAVFGIPDDEWGEQVKAAVEPAAGCTWTDDLELEVTAFARERLAGYKVPRSWDVHERLPRADTGKLDVRSLRDPYWAGRDRAI